IPLRARQSLSRLFSSKTNHEHKSFVCHYCLHRFSKEYNLKKHLPDCSTHAPCRISFPSTKPKKKKQSQDENEEDIECIEDLLEIEEKDEGLAENILTFTNVQHEYPVIFALYVNFESFIVKDTELKDLHEPSGFCCLRVSTKPEHNNNQAFVYSGLDVMRNFFSHLEKEHSEINAILDKNESMLPLTDDEKSEYEEATHCTNCDREFTR